MPKEFNKKEMGGLPKTPNLSVLGTIQCPSVSVVPSFPSLSPDEVPQPSRGIAPWFSDTPTPPHDNGAANQHCREWEPMRDLDPVTSF